MGVSSCLCSFEGGGNVETAAVIKESAHSNEVCVVAKEEIVRLHLDVDFELMPVAQGLFKTV